MYKMKYSCYQEYFIHGWFVYWILVKKYAACGKSDFREHRFQNEPNHFTLLVKSQAILALFDGFQDLHLDW